MTALRLLHATLALGWAAGCLQQPREELPAAAPVDSTRTPPRMELRADELRFAVGSMLSPIATFDSYNGLFAYLAANLERPYRFVQRRTYRELNDLILAGDVDLAFICAGAFAAFPEDAGVEILAVPVVGGRTTYRSLVVVRGDSDIAAFADLEGKRFGYTDPLSNTGYIEPAAHVVRLGKDPATFFSKILISGSHDRSVLALRQGLVDGIAVFDLNFERYATVGGPEIRDLRIIDRSPEYAMPPVVAPKSVPAALRRQLQSLLLGLDQTTDGRALLSAIGADRFVAEQPLGYEPIRRNRELLRGATR